MKASVFKNKLVKNFLSDSDVIKKIKEQGFEPEEWFAENYNFYKENWKHWGIEGRFNLEILIYNFEVDLGLA